MRTASKIVLRVTEELLLGAYTGNVALFHAIYIISEVSHHLTGAPSLLSLVWKTNKGVPLGPNGTNQGRPGDVDAPNHTSLERSMSRAD